MPHARTAALIAALILTASRAAAQEATPRTCHATSPVSVVVTPVAGESIRGTLLCLSGDQVVLAREGQVTTTDLAAIWRIETPADPVWDGALKGAVVPLIGWLVFADGSSAEWMLRAVAAYGSIGAVIDALDRNQTRIYDQGRRASVGWRIRF